MFSKIRYELCFIFLLSVQAEVAIRRFGMYDGTGVYGGI